MKEKLFAYLKAVWPTVYRLINDGLYFLLRLLKSTIHDMIEQLKGNV